MNPEDTTVRKSRRAQGMEPEISGMATSAARKQRQKKQDAVDSDESSLDEKSEKSSAVSQKTQRSKKSNYSTAISNKSKVRRQTIELELKSMERLTQMEEELEMVEKRKIEREMRMEKKKCELQKALIEDQACSDVEDEEKSVVSVRTTLSLPKDDKNTSIQMWVDESKKEAQPEKNEVVVLKHLADTNKRLDRMMCRQSVSKELPSFSGDPEEWPMFVMQFCRTTELCGLSDDENVLRLQKCLRGKAREAVLPMLTIPENVGAVMESLELMFGRQEQIIESLVMKVTSSSPVDENRPESLIHFSNLISNLCATMKSLKSLGHLRNPTLLKEIVVRLPISLQYKWCEYYIDLAQDPSLEDMSQWLRKVAMTASLLPTTTKSFQMEQKKKKHVLTAVPQNEKSSCNHCNTAGHSVTKCRKFQSDDVQKRWKTVKDNHLCFSCLAKGHRTSDCPKKSVCGIDGCDRVHHKLLHKAREVHAAVNVPLVAHTALSDVMRDTLLRVIPVKVAGPGGEVETYALLDEGSSISMVDSSLAEKLQLTGPIQALCVQWTNGMVREERNSRKVSVKISGVAAGAKVFSLHGVRTVEGLELPSQSLDMDLIREKWPFLHDIPFNSLREAKPLVLIGSDNIILTASRQLRHGSWNQPVATKTWLGWVVHGNIPKPKPVQSFFSFVVCEQARGDEELNQLIRDSFSTEAFGVQVTSQPSRSKEDQRALAIMERTTQRIGDGNRFETGLLWKTDDCHLPESRTNALRRLQCMERKMDRDEQFASQYCSKVEDFITKGYCRKLTPSEAAVKTRKTWYIPHFAVFNPNKPGKMRLVFDAAAKSHGVSLNDNLLKGPDLLNPLPGVLIRFRVPIFGFMGDVEEMFPQMKIINEDIQSQRFLWRGKERTRNPDDYVMTSMFFGSASSPSSAMYVKNKNAEDFKEEFPAICKAIIENSYMDDLLDGAHLVDEVTQKIHDCIEVFRRGGFRIRNWASNSREVMQQIPPELRAKGWVSLEEDSVLPVERVLGLRWNPEDDEFVFLPNFHRVSPGIINGSIIPTKRELLRLVMSVFDPLGFIGHFTVKARIRFQQLWLSKLDWDDKLNEEQHGSWLVWLNELRNITQVKIPRCYSLKITEASFQLHVFCDASQEAFAACVYLRSEVSGAVDVALVCAKTRVAPTKPLTIPRLELQAALMGARLCKTVRDEIRIEFTEVHFWSDSKTVISWIRTESHRFKQFVANRVGEILELTEVKDWHWVPTDLNVADDATRSDKPTDFSPDGRWFKGPEFLRLPRSHWPQVSNLEKPDFDEEMKKDFIGLQVQVEAFRFPDPGRFSSYLKTVRTTAWVRRFVRNCSARVQGIVGDRGELEMEEIELAKRIWFKAVQRESFPDELGKLRNGEPLNGKSRLLTLSPFLSEDGLLRVRGRIERAPDLPEEAKFPVILDPGHLFTQLYCSHFHVQCGHNGVETVLNTMRQSVWILRMRSAVKKAFRDCQFCKIRKAAPSPPFMASLPPERLLVQSRPFSYVGLDYFGPVMVTNGRQKLKRYGVLFTCLSVRAVHLEISKDLSTDSAINALRRFISRRLLPVKVFSDNGTNFRGASREIAEAVRALDGDRIQREMGVDWCFIPPASPHMGGSWERLVKSVKVALETTLFERAPQEDVLHTLMLEAEFIINSRPLTHVSVDPDDPVSLTPNHFLHPLAHAGATFGVFDDDDLCRRKQWRHVQRFSDSFWLRWVKEYLPSLTRRTKWNKEERSVQIGDIVLIVDKDGPRYSWPLGRVVGVFPGKDGRVRVVDVKTKDGVYRRPVVKIAILDVRKIDEENQIPSSGGRNVQD